MSGRQAGEDQAAGVTVKLARAVRPRRCEPAHHAEAATRI